MRKGDLLDQALARSAHALEPRDYGWVQELVYGTVRLQGRIDHILKAFVRTGTERLDQSVLDVLRLGAYQILAMESVPAYAAVSQSVELVRSAGYARAAGFVNGVLQSVRRQGTSVAFPSIEQDPVDHLVTWGSHPQWLVERWVARWGVDDAQRLVESNNRRPELYLTPVAVSATEASERLAADGVATSPVDGFPDSVRILAPAQPREALAIVPAVVQDPAAAMVVRYADVPVGSVVLDIAAAPGGKAAALAGRGSFVVASDLSPGRLRRVRANVERTGLSDRVGLVVADGRQPPFRLADAVLLDAPCTGTGTLRRHPDGRWRLRPEDLAALSDLQRDLLEATATVVRPGGVLVYSTCSLEPEENELQVEQFLERHPEFSVQAPETPIDGTMLSEGFLTVLPQRHGVDGAFAARLIRIA